MYKRRVDETYEVEEIYRVIYSEQIISRSHCAILRDSRLISETGPGPIRIQKNMPEFKDCFSRNATIIYKYNRVV